MTTAQTLGRLVAVAAVLAALSGSATAGRAQDPSTGPSTTGATVCVRSDGSSTGEPTASLKPGVAEWQAVGIEDDGISLRLPSDWTVVDLTRDDLESWLDSAGDLNPQMAQIVRSELEAGLPTSMEAMAAAMPGDPFVTNVNITRQPSLGYPAPLLRTMTVIWLAGMSYVSGEIPSESMTVGGHPGFHLTYRVSMTLPDSSIRAYCVDQFAAVSDTAVWIVTWSDDLPASALLDQVLQTLVLTE